MALRNTDRSWGSAARFMHWVIALLIFTQFALGWMAVSWRLSPTKLNLYIWHKSIGILILALVVLRIAWRFFNRTPALPVGTPPFERVGAHASHGLLYVLMLVMPLSGWVINSASNIPLRVFWLFPLPVIVPPDKALEAFAKHVHFGLFIALAIVVTLHVAAALRHHFVKGNDVLTRMLTGGTRI